MIGLFHGILVFAPPLVLAALGGVLSEKAGVVNIGLEGMMRVGAFAAATAAFFTGSPWVGVACGALAGGAAAAIHAVFAVRLRADQVVSGIALNLVALGLVTFLLESIFGSSGVSPAVPTLPRGPGGHTIFAVAAFAVPLLLHVALARTPWGLRVRAVGEHPHAAATVGVRVVAVRMGCVIGSGVLAGLGGAALSVGILGQFDTRMPAGQGFMALAAMVFGRWTALGAAGAAFFFAAADALQRELSFSLGASDLHVDGVFLALPYAATLLVLAFGSKRVRAPAADGVPYEPEGRA
ncbi:MAG: ABC transporter permease [Myxococcales bacterium]